MSPAVTMEWYPSRPGSHPGKSRRRCAPLDSWRASADAATSRASGCGSSSRAVRDSASRSSPAPRQTASRVALDGGSTCGGGGDAFSGGGRLVEAGGGGAAAEHEALRERVGGEPVGAVEAGAGGLADRVEAGHGGAAVEVGDDAAHHVVGGGGDGDELGHRVEAGVAEGLDDVGEAPGVDAAHVEVDVRLRAVASMRSPDGAGDLVAGGELVDEALAGVVVERGALAAERPRWRGSPRGP